MEPKKRGRKPKNKIIINENPVFNTTTDNLILTIHKKYISNNDSNELLDNSTNIQGLSDNKYSDINIIEKEESVPHCQYVCWNCCYDIFG